MFDVLVYVFENYLPDACPEPDALARRLTAAGFGEEDISEAIQWLAGLEESQDGCRLRLAPAAGSLRIYDRAEEAKLAPECRGFLAFLEQADAIDATTREVILERAMAVDGPRVTLAKFKVIVLMVLWRRQLSLDSLVFEDLLAEEGDDPPGPMH